MSWTARPRRAPRGSPLLVFVTDGENTAAVDQVSFAGIGTRVRTALVLGYGSVEGGVMPLARVAVDQQPPAAAEARSRWSPPRETGEPALSRLDEGQPEARSPTRSGRSSVLSRRHAGLRRGRGRAGAGGVRRPRSRAEPERELRWVWAILLLALFALLELRSGWREDLAARREGRP